MMEKLIKIRNSQGKLVCVADTSTKTIEIALKGVITTIQFCQDGSIKVTNKDNK